MVLASILAHSSTSSGNPALAGRIAGFAFLIAAICLAFLWPRRMYERRTARIGQLSVGAFAIAASLAGGAFVMASMAHGSAWFVKDNISNPSTLVLLSTVLLTGSMLVLVGTQQLSRSSVNWGAVMAFPAWSALILDTLTLGYCWFGRSASATWAPSGADRNGVLTVATVSAVNAAIGIVGSIGLTVRYSEVRGTMTRALMVGSVAALPDASLYLVHATIHFSWHVNGGDMVVAGCFIGAAAYVAGLVVEKRAVANASTRSHARVIRATGAVHSLAIVPAIPEWTAATAEVKESRAA